MGTRAVISHNDKLGAGARLLTDLFCWFPWVSSSGFGSLKLGTSEYTMQNLQRQRQHPCFNTTFKYQFRRSRLLLNYLTTCFHNGIKLCIDVLQPRLKQTTHSALARCLLPEEKLHLGQEDHSSKNRCVVCYSLSNLL